MNDKWEISLLYDFYGGLLNESQQKVVELYVNSDLSYAESAELLGISRQGVKDALIGRPRSSIPMKRSFLCSSSTERRRTLWKVS